MEFVLKALAKNEIFSSSRSLDGFNLSPTEYFTATLVVVFLMFSCMPGVKMLVNERLCGITKRLISASVKMRYIILSKFIVTFLVALLQFSVFILLTSVIFNNYWNVSISNIVFIFLGIIFSVSAWSIFVSVISKTRAASDIIGNLGILLMAVLGGSIYPLFSVPTVIKKLSYITINRWATEGFMVIFSSHGTADISRYLVALVIIGFVFLGASVAVLKLKRG
jgi:ABC-2 type transport system permease protein